MARVDRSPCSAAATAAEPPRLLILHRRDFDEILHKESLLAVKLVRSFVQVRTELLRKTTADFSADRAEPPVNGKLHPDQVSLEPSAPAASSVSPASPRTTSAPASR